MSYNPSNDPVENARERMENHSFDVVTLLLAARDVDSRALVDLVNDSRFLAKLELASRARREYLGE